ncbi:MAG: cell division protein FtsN [Alteromonadaceae bacterium]|jgi:cell division protein FtsN
MAHQDYVSRAQNKKKQPYKNKQVDIPQKRPFKLKLIGVFTLISVSAFGYFLWSIKDNQPLPIESSVVKSISPSTKATTLPTPPKEKWAYRKELTEKKVEVGEYEVKNKGPYKMQCGSFRTRKQAEVLKANIAFSGFSSQIGESKGKNGTHYKVFLGPYSKKRQAEKDKHKLRKNNINFCEIWGWK